MRDSGSLIERKLTRQVQVGGVTIGGDAPIRLQSMTTSHTRDVEQTVDQIQALAEVGCELVRVACPTEQDARALGKIRSRIKIPLIVDIHFNHRFALIALDEGVDKLRLNPGNIGKKERTVEIVRKAKERKVPIRIGVNSGSLEEDLMEKFDLKTDPGETENLALAQPERVRALKAEFEKWFAGVTAGQKYDRVPIEVGRKDENPVEIDLLWGEPVGKKVRPTYFNYNRDTIENWSEVEDLLRWKIEVVQAGRYDVILSYGCDSEDAGSQLKVTAGRSSIKHQVQRTAGRTVFRPLRIGTLTLEAGNQMLVIKPESMAGKELFALHKIWLKRLTP